MRTAYLGLGSNIDAEKNMVSAVSCLRHAFGEIGLSPFYLCTPFGFEGDDFINGVARVDTQWAPLELKNWLTGLEDRHDRERKGPRYSSRTLDVDILLYDDLYLLSPQLEIPREEILKGAYVLRPLADLAPELIHPCARRTMQELWESFEGETSGLRRIDLHPA